MRLLLFSQAHSIATFPNISYFHKTIHCQLQQSFFPNSSNNHRCFATRCMSSAAIAEMALTTRISSQHAPTATTGFVIVVRSQQNTTTIAPLSLPRLRTTTLRPLPLTIVRLGSRAVIKTFQLRTSTHAFQRATAVATPNIPTSPCCVGNAAHVMATTVLLRILAVRSAIITTSVVTAKSGMMQDNKECGSIGGK